MGKLDLTWQEVLKQEGFINEVAESFVGFIAWEKNNMFPKLGKEITEVLAGHEGRVYVKDIISKKYNNTGLLFFNNNVLEEVAEQVFVTILDYEHQEVYDV